MTTNGRARHGRALGVGAAFAFAAALWLPAPAGAALIPVTETADDLISAADDGDCALREAIDAANRNAVVDQCVAGEAEPAGDTVLLADGATYALTGAPDDDDNLTGDLDIDTLADSGPLTIQGGNDGGSTIDGGAIDRVLDVGGVSTLDSLTITNGDVPTVGGGIRNGAGTLSVSRSRIQGNAAVLGGGIANPSGGTLFLDSSVVTDNQVGAPDVQPVAGGGILNQGTATIDGSVVSSNHAQGVGGLPVVGAGIANLQDGSLTVTDSTVADNAISGGDQYGAGISHEGGTSSLSVRNSTISGNLAPGVGADGGGLNSFGGEVSLNHVTFAGNQADHRGDAIRNFGGPLGLRASVIDNGGTACQGDIASGGFNVDAAATCASAATSTDLQSAATGLDLHLLNNGGPSAGPTGSSEIPGTHALGEGSPAIDRVPAAQCFDLGTTLLATDQRGVPRPEGSAGCDSGAYEIFVPFSLAGGEVPATPAESSPQVSARKKCKRKKRPGGARKRRCKRRR